jgi:hypothetical protein
MRGASLMILLVVSGLASSCAPNKVLQCNRIVEIANQVTAETEILTADQTNQDSLVWLQAADTLDQAAQTMQSLQLDDPQLKEYQGGFVRMYTEIASATRDYSQSYKDLNREGVDTAKVRLEQAVQGEPALVNGINDYCVSQ